MCLYRKTYIHVSESKMCLYVKNIHVSESKMCLYRKTYMLVNVKSVYIEKHTCQ